jgi:ABC-type multidrug transport system fused ATPase/permease subunit
METSLYRFIVKYSAKEQLVLLVITGISFPFLYYSYDLPKLIVNQAINGKNFPKDLLGMPFEQIPYLFLLCGLFLVLVCVNGGFKYYINIYQGRVGERMLRRLRYELYARILRFPLPHFKKVSQGELIPMITAEVEPIGGFIGEAINGTVFQAGQLITVIIFLFVQDWKLGVAATALYPFQGWLIPRLQKKVNQLGKERVRTVRKLSERIGESVSGVTEVHAHNAARHKLAEFSDRLGTIFDIRFDIYNRKFFVKFLNNFINQLTPFFFFTIGGYLVIKGEMSSGALVGALIAYKDMSAPWRELLNYYQQKEDIRIKYEQVVEQFVPAGTMPAEIQLDEPALIAPLQGQIEASNVGLTEDGKVMIVDSASFAFALNEHVAIVGPSGCGKDALGQIIARLLLPSSGQIAIAGQDMSALPEAVTGRRLAYVGATAYVFSASLGENILMGVMHKPVQPAGYDEAAERRARKRQAESAVTGNSTDDIAADWVDSQAAGVADRSALATRLIQVLHQVDLEEDVYYLGLRGTIDPARRPEVAARILQARAALRDRLSEPAYKALVEPFDETTFNQNATVAENLLFGTPVGDVFDIERLAENAYVREVLDKVGLTEDLIGVGREVARTMVELFADLPPGHEFFAQYSFISSDDLPEFQAILARSERAGTAGLAPEDRQRLLSLPFKLSLARHRLGLIDGAIQARLLEARRAFAQNIPDRLRAHIELFERTRYNAASTIQDNILFGKLAYGQAQAAQRIGELIADTLRKLGLRDAVVEVGLDYQVGVGGARLSAAQRQKIGIARCLLRRPDALIVNEATALLDSAAQNRILDNLVKEQAGRGLIWVLHRANLARSFHRILVMKDGRIVQQGRFDDLNREGSAFAELLAKE